MENLAASTPALPQGVNAQASDAALAGVPIDLPLAGEAGQSFVALLARQVTLLLPRDETPAERLLKETERQTPHAGEQDAGLALLGLPAQVAAAIDPALMPMQALLQGNPGGHEKLQKSVVDVPPVRSSAANGKVLPMPDAKTSDLAALGDTQSQIPEHPTRMSSEDMQEVNSPSGQTPAQKFSEVLADRKINSFRQDPIQSQLAATPVIQPQSGTPSTISAVSPAQPEMTIAQKVGSESWGSGLGDKVVWVIGNQTRGAEIHLNPPALGPLEIHVNVSDGQANVSFMTQHASVREAIEAATPRLREMLGDAGISMGSVSVNVGTFAQQQQQFRQSSPGAATWVPEPEARMDAFGNEIVSSISQPLHGRGMVDLFA